MLHLSLWMAGPTENSMNNTRGKQFSLPTMCFLMSRQDCQLSTENRYTTAENLILTWWKDHIGQGQAYLTNEWLIYHVTPHMVLVSIMDRSNVAECSFWSGPTLFVSSKAANEEKDQCCNLSSSLESEMNFNLSLCESKAKVLIILHFQCFKWD